MLQNSLAITKTQRKWFLTFSFLAFLTLMLNICAQIVELHNREIAREQIDKNIKADGGASFTITSCDYIGGPQIENVNRFLNFAVLSLSFLFLWKPKFIRFVFSTLLLGFSFTHFGLWFCTTINNHFYPNAEVPLPLHFDSQLILGRSNFFDVILFALISIIFIWQLTISILAILCRVKSRKYLP